VVPTLSAETPRFFAVVKLDDENLETIVVLELLARGSIR
jgi:hypothetical protein